MASVSKQLRKASKLRVKVLVGTLALSIITQ